MARSVKKRSRSGTLRAVKSALTEIVRTTPKKAAAEAEMYVCSVCRLPVRACNTNPDAPCTNMLLGGTQLQLLRSVGSRPAVCIRCGGPIPKKLLKSDPLAELCPQCQPSSSKSKLPKRSKGATQ